MSSEKTHFDHVWVQGTSPFTLVLLHGTGGNENDLIDIGKGLLPEASILGIRGKVSEGGLNRWFKRHAEGVFDEEDIRVQSADLADFLAGFSGIKIAVGYSNGANMGAATMLLHSELLDGLVMWRGMLPLMPSAIPDLANKKILMINGDRDPMAPNESSRNLKDLFSNAKADIEQVILPNGHQLTKTDIDETRRWLAFYR
jgi:phospholipase/carboxylesterase